MSYLDQVEMLRKFLLVGVLVFVFPGEPGQLGTGMLIVFAFLVMQLLQQPCATADLNNMQAISQSSLMLTLFVGLMTVIDKYIEREQLQISEGPWAFVDAGQSSVRELNRLLFTIIGVAVNLFTMSGPPLLIARKMYNEMGTREEVIKRMRDQVRFGTGGEVMYSRCKCTQFH